MRSQHLDAVPPDQQHLVLRAAANIQRGFAGTFGRETVERFARERLRALARVEGIDITSEFTKPLTHEVVQAADVVVTMGCGDACPVYPGKRYEDWELQSSTGSDLASARAVRDEIKVRVEALAATLGQVAR